MSDTPSPARLALDELFSRFHGVLSTQSVDVPGYPFGSVTPYVPSPAGEPLVFISTLAQHTRNIQADPRVSLTVYDGAAEDPQAGARVTYLADAEKHDDAAALARYLRHFPQAEGFTGTHDFALYRLVPRRIRFIGGFGRIHWVETSELPAENPLAPHEDAIVAHMNEDHQETMKLYCRALKGFEAGSALMAGIDPAGCNVLADDRLVRFGFDEPVHTPEQARKALVAMAARARG